VLGGEHTGAILRELGYADAEITRLRQSGVTWTEPVAALGG
jgi:crotonobetainyl-CoA:carnitine CoA-transferase CaiB-like acyl-CoA transferase